MTFTCSKELTKIKMEWNKTQSIKRVRKNKGKARDLKSQPEKRKYKEKASFKFIFFKFFNFCCKKKFEIILNSQFQPIILVSCFKIWKCLRLKQRDWKIVWLCEVCWLERERANGREKSEVANVGNLSHLPIQIGSNLG